MRLTGVWARRRFRLFWAGDTISALGSALSLAAVPILAADVLGASPGEVGVLKAAQTLPFLLLAVPLGAYADKSPRRGMLLAADVARFPLVAAIALLGGALPVAGLIALAFLVGIGTVAYEVAYLSALPELVSGPEELPAANRAVETAHAAASLLGLATAGTLIAALNPQAAIAIDAATFGIGALLTTVNRWPSPVHSPVAGAEGGWRWLRRDPFVRPMTLYLAVNNLAASAFQTALLFYLLKTLHRPGATLGFALAASGLGFLAGAAVSPRLATRFGTGRVIVAGSLIGALGIGLIAVPGGLAPVLLGAVISGAGPGLLNIHSIAVRQAVTPPALLGRVNAVVKTVSYGTTTLGALIGGWAIDASGPRAVIVAAAVVSALATVFPAASAVSRLRDGAPRPRRP